MANYLAVDSGGTKVLAIRYSDDFKPIAISRVGSFRRNTTSEELVLRNMKQMQQELGLVPGTVIDHITGIVYPEFVEFLKQSCSIQKVDIIDELQAGLCAAGIFGDGLMTLSGTGSNVSALYQEKIYFSGGYGASVSDAGSGYWIAREAMNVAIADYEGYGEKTQLTQLIAEHFGYDREHLKEAIFSIYENMDFSPVAQVADCAPLVSRAAGAGDQAAVQILRSAGEILGKQAVASIRKNSFPDDLPITISGSAWRSDHILFDTFAECIRRQSPERPIRIPEFEPILGVMIRHYLQMHGQFGEQDTMMLKELYPQYLFQI